jgi:hypothetical protein
MNREYLLKRIADAAIVDLMTDWLDLDEGKANGYRMIYIHAQHQIIIHTPCRLRRADPRQAEIGAHRQGH